MNLNKKQALIYVCPECDRRVKIEFKGYKEEEILRLRILCEVCRNPLITLMDYLWGDKKWLKQGDKRWIRNQMRIERLRKNDSRTL